MNYKFGTAPTIKLFNQLIGRLRRTKIKSLILAFFVGAMVTLLSAPVQAAGTSPQDRGWQLGDTFSILLQGPYKQVLHAPDLGLTMVDLDDGTFSKTKIFRVSGLPDEDRDHGNRDGDTKKPIDCLRPPWGRDNDAYRDLHRRRRGGEL